MAKRSKKKSKRKTEGRITSFYKTICNDEHRWLRQLFVRVFLLAAGALLVVWGFGRMEAYVRTVNQQRQVAVRVEFAQRPAWATDELMDALKLDMKIDQTPSWQNGVFRDEARSYDDSSSVSPARFWADNLRQNPWVKSIKRIHYRYDGLIMVDCDIRYPVAVVAKNGRNYYLDMDGVVLPAYPTYCHMIQIEGEHQLIPGPGKSVKSNSVRSGLQVLAAIMEVDQKLPVEERLYNQLASIDVGNYNGQLERRQSHLTLYTRHGTPILWGAAIGKEKSFYEAPKTQKLLTLYYEFRENNYNLDKQSAIDLRLWRQERFGSDQQG